MDNKIFPIIVVYRADLTTCETFRTLAAELAGRDYLIYDNSPRPLNAHLAAADAHILYHNDSHNGGVSAAYNFGARAARERGFSHILLLDQDTRFDGGFLSAMEDAVAAHPDMALFVPNIVLADGRPFSPVGISWWRARGCNLPEGPHALGRYLPVNSGSCLSLTAFGRAGGYNAHIRLDFADFDFFSRLSAVIGRFYVIRQRAVQSFSNEETDTNRLIRRFGFYLEGARATACRRRFVMHVVRHTLALTLRTRNVTFLRLLLKNYLFRL